MVIDACMQNMTNCRRCKLRGRTQERIRKALVVNFKEDRYIKLAHLKQLLHTSLVLELLCHTHGQSEAQESLNPSNTKNQAEEI